MRKQLLGTIAVVALLGLTLLGASGGAVAETYEPVNSTDMPINETVTPDSETESLQVIAENVTNETASVTVYEIDNGTETQVGTGTLNTTSTTTDVYEYSQINTSLEYRVLVEGDGADMIDVAKVQVVSAGGGGSGDLLGSVSMPALPGDSTTILGLALALIGGGGLAYGRYYGN
ncbi:hypothetical protein [Halapricum desulfuricans]|uniref:Uncharacterized protein n=1 Tax=Halapricum desulfuricans TaxID=2841257 RepID=A0A897N3A7_9EURY|nr:hypothetical protein [Halapricum desulfuricans]QSG08880.1 hypothetical protein HSR122_1487 [Halapricum desulfuricans]